jgi:hypothetical protein
MKMHNILNKLLIENGFKETSKNIYNLKNIDSLIISEYTELDIINFFEAKVTKNVLEKYNENIKENLGLKKNTSLLAYVKVTNVKASLTRLKNTIFNIEEDEYYFRKFVFFYTDEMLGSIDIKKDIKEQLNTIVDDGDIDKLREDCFSDLVYFFALQLFIKLPWLSFDIERTKFELLEGPLNRKILDLGLETFDQVLDRVDMKFMDDILEKNKVESLNENEFQSLMELFGDKK